MWSVDAASSGSSNITGWPTGKRRCDLVFQLDDDFADPDVDGSLGVRLNRWTIAEYSTGRAMPQVVAAADFRTPLA